MSDFICPFCKEKLRKDENRYICENGHSFDVAKEGYVHLLPVNKMHSKVPGDSKEMVLSRRRFLHSGYYDIFSDKLNEIVLKYALENAFIIDAGCGEGFYTQRLASYLSRFLSVKISGIDISKYAVRYASKSDKSTDYAVASIFEMPFADVSADIVIDIFAPIVESEFYRVLRKRGILIIAVPSEEHLYGLKKIAYSNPYKNEKRDTFYDGFELLERIPVRDSITVSDSLIINDLFTMTPYYLKTGAEDKAKIEKCDRLETEIGFDFLVYRKK